jgi:hypothetical protein
MENKIKRSLLVALVSRRAPHDCRFLVHQVGADLGFVPNIYVGVIPPHEPEFTNSVIEEVKPELCVCRILILVVQAFPDFLSPDEWMKQPIEIINRQNWKAKVLLYAFSNGVRKKVFGRVCKIVASFEQFEVALRKDLGLQV